MSEAIDAIRDERNHWIGEAKKFERYWKSSNKDATRWLKERNEARERAERAEAELAALRERVRGLADNADRWAARPINGNAFDATVPTDDLRDLLDDDTAGAASGEGKK